MGRALRGEFASKKYDLPSANKLIYRKRTNKAEPFNEAPKQYFYKPTSCKRSCLGVCTCIAAKTNYFTTYANNTYV